MKPRHTIPTLLLAALIVSGGWERGREGCGILSECFWPATQVPEVVNQANNTTAEATGRAVAAEVRPAVEWSAGGAVVGVVHAESAALLAEQATVQLMMKHTAVELTSAQWSELAAITAHYQTVRQTFEATIATVVGAENLRMEIPAYPLAGDALREKFYGEMRERLGDATAELVGERAGAALEGYFGGFGVGVQTLDFSAQPGIARADLQVTRTAHYWKSSEGRELLTLRRETHFPELEDPTGERWGPFLALLANRGTE